MIKMILAAMYMYFEGVYPHNKEAELEGNSAPDEYASEDFGNTKASHGITGFREHGPSGEIPSRINLSIGFNSIRKESGFRRHGGRGAGFSRY